MPSLVLAPSRESPPTPAPSAWLAPLRDVTGPGEAGHKAWDMARMSAAGVPIPATIVIKCGHRGDNDDAAGQPPAKLIDALRARTAAWLANGPLVLRGSSAAATGVTTASTAAGRRDLFSDLRTFDALADAIGACWPAACSASASGSGPSEPAGAGFIIQPQIEPAMSGLIRPVVSPESPATTSDYDIECCDGAIDAMAAGWVDAVRLRVRLDDAAVAPTFRAIAHHAARLARWQIHDAARSPRHEDVLAGPHALEWAVDRAGAVWVIAVRQLAQAARPALAVTVPHPSPAPSRRPAWRWPTIPTVRIVYRRPRLWSPEPIDAVTA